ncbi:uncharacterized protein LOC126744064 isoform X3 [Anthonomus grandis grandis]|uniref:uncharacterized protein LOC126744064 isoform X3 n=1 Tax=Anthonomus grandis grandis TaxID=2921223 RepID=UPI002165E2ED|nr:uncharacterized protein LOC126744064 isoform X3 [Anthonomus grandis grandis]
MSTDWGLEFEEDEEIKNEKSAYVKVVNFKPIQVPLPSSFYYPQNYPLQLRRNPLYQTRGPFDFIGQWIQQTPWLPIQVNVPDMFQTIGSSISQASNNIQQLSQQVGSGVSQFTQNVGNGFNQFTQNVGNGFNQWMQQLGQRVPIFGNVISTNRVTQNDNKNGQQAPMVPVQYPEGQELILEEVLDSFP